MPDSLRKFISKTDPIKDQPAEVRWLFELRRYRSLIEALGGNLRTDTADCYIGSNRGRVREEERRNSWTEVLDRELLTCEKAAPRTRSMGVVRASHRISSYSYSAKRYSVKRYSYSMAV